MALITLKNITKTYPFDGGTISALQDINLDINDGEFLVIMGPSGSGKSTLLNIIAGLDRPTSGQFLYRGKDMEKASTSLLALYRQRVVGIVFQSFNLISTLSALENIKLPRLLSNRQKDATKDAEALLQELGIPDKAKVTPNRLSGGQQQRVTIARALINNPDIILADEPTGNLDSATGDAIVNTLKEINTKKGKTVIIITHNPDIAKFADRIVHMKDGGIEHVETVKMIADPESTNGSLSGKPGSLKLTTTFILALANLRRTKLRTFLTALGVSIGVAALILLVAFASAIENSIISSFTSVVGLKQIQVSSQSGGLGLNLGRRNAEPVSSPPLTPASLDAIEKIQGVASAYPLYTYIGNISYHNAKTTFFAQSAAPVQYLNQTNENVSAGKLFTSDTEKSIILTENAAKALGVKQPNDIVGKEVSVDLSLLSTSPSAQTQQSYTQTLNVAGISGASGLASASYLPHDLYVPTGNNITYNNIVVNAKTTDDVANVKSSIEKLGYSATSAQDIISQIQKVFVVVKAAFGVIGGIGLVVACLGIINVMLISVLERFKEIGIMKAVGARPGDIRRLFIVEGAIIGLLGGIAGVIIGSIAGYAIDNIANVLIVNNGGTRTSLFSLSPLLVSAAIAIAIFISIAASLYPAARAAKLNPIEALRRE